MASESRISWCASIRLLLGIFYLQQMIQEYRQLESVSNFGNFCMTLQFHAARLYVLWVSQRAVIATLQGDRLAPALTQALLQATGLLLGQKVDQSDESSTVRQGNEILTVEK